MPKVLILIIGTKVKETKVRTMETTIKRVNMSEMGTTIVKTTKTRKTIATEKIWSVLTFLLKIGNLVIGKLEVVCHKLRI